MKQKSITILLLLFFILLQIPVFSQSKNSTSAVNYSVEKKTEDLLAAMTLEEKIGQMTQICFSTITLDGTKNLDLNVDLVRKAILEYHVGSFLSGTGSKEKWIKFITDVQRIAIEETRLSIPLLIGIDHIHGANYVDNATYFPHNLTLSCSFDTSVISNAALVTAIETAPLGLIWNFAPVLDVGMNPYWPRLYETFGEDPIVCAKMGKAFINRYQNCNSIQPVKLSACAKHFIGYSNPKSGWDRTPAEISRQKLYEDYVPPFRYAIDNGVKSVMINSGEVNGIPAHRSKFLLDTVLRQKLGFTGVVITDIKDVLKIVEMHAGAHNEKEATLAAINAGIDMNMVCNTYNFCQIMKELVAEGKIPEKRIDASVRRILRMKYELGLFKNPYPIPEKASHTGSEKHLKAAQHAAENSIVLLKNNGVLPLTSKQQKIAVTGFAANSKKMLNGAWTLEWLGAEEERHPKNMQTLYSAMKNEFPDKTIKWVKTPDADNKNALIDFTKQLAQYDAIVLTVGEKPYSEFKGNINDLNLCPKQQKIAHAAMQCEKPLIVILIEGRPRLINNIVNQSDAVLFAGYPGVRGAEALVNILSGTVNPSGRLSFTYPKYPAHCVPYYHKHSDKYHPLFPFGYGLSYTNFTYSNLTLSDTVLLSADKTIIASVNVKNTGKNDGKETILWYISDKVGKITRPVKQLKHFEKITLKAGEEKTVFFRINPMETLSYPDQNGIPVIEKGGFTIQVENLQKSFNFK